MPTLEELTREYETVERHRCRDCVNPWWFSMPHCYVCTTCSKTHARSSDDLYVAKNALEQNVSCGCSLSGPGPVTCPHGKVLSGKLE